jgi:hypothetical protein
MRWIFLILFSAQLATARERRMFNACDHCRSWAPIQTAHLLKALDNYDVHYEFWSINSVVILSPPKDEGVRCYEYFALFFDSRRSCQDFSRSLKIKCELTVTPVTGN